jgi:hypothetical protein
VRDHHCPWMTTLPIFARPKHVRCRAPESSIRRRPCGRRSEAAVGGRVRREGPLRTGVRRGIGVAGREREEAPILEAAEREDRRRPACGNVIGMQPFCGSLMWNSMSLPSNASSAISAVDGTTTLRNARDFTCATFTNVTLAVLLIPSKHNCPRTSNFTTTDAVGTDHPKPQASDGPATDRSLQCSNEQTLTEKVSEGNRAL